MFAKLSKTVIIISSAIIIYWTKLSSASIFPDEPYGLNDLLGNESNWYFNRFDIILEGLKDYSKETQFRKKEVANAASDDPNFDTNNFWSTIHQTSDRNVTLAVLISLKNLTFLQEKLNDIKSHFNKDENVFHQKPYFFIIYPKIMTPEEETEIRDNAAEYASGFQVDTDVYLTYLQCSPIVDNSNKSGSKSCPPGQTTMLRTLEFYYIKDQAFIEPVKLFETQLAQKIIRRTNFKGSPLPSIAAFGYPHRAMFNEKNDSFKSGYEAEQIRFLGDAFNFSIMAGVGKGWITENPDKTLSGMGQQVIDGEADISISASEVLPYRAVKLTFLHPTYYTKMWGFFVQPPSSSFRDIFIHAFTGDLWLTMFSTWILIVLAMAALSVVKRRLDTMHENDTVLIQELIIWAAGAICQQGWHICPESTCMKIIFIFALITGLVSYVAYSAALVSILSVKVVPIKHLNDVVSHRYTIYQDNQTINVQYVIQELESSGAIPCLSLEQRSIRSESALPKILTSSSAFIGASDFFYPVARKNMNDTEICKFLSRISITTRPIRGGMFIRKGSPLKDFLNHKLLIMYERGIRFRLLENYFRESSVMCLEKNGATKDPLGFNDVYTAFVILLLGYCVSFCILVIERMFPPAQYQYPDEGDSDNISTTCSKGVLKILGCENKMFSTADGSSNAKSINDKPYLTFSNDT